MQSNAPHFFDRFLGTPLPLMGGEWPSWMIQNKPSFWKNLINQSEKNRPIANPKTTKPNLPSSRSEMVRKH